MPLRTPMSRLISGSAFEAAGGDVFGGLGDGSERTQCPVGHQPASGRHEQESRRQCDEEDVPHSPQVSDRENALGRTRRAAGNGVETGDQLLDEEGLGEVIVGAEVEAFEAFVKFAAGGEEDDREGDLPFAEVAEDAEAVAVWEHDVQDQSVVGARSSKRVALIAAEADVHHEALGLEALADKRRDLLIVLDDQNLHGRRFPFARPGLFAGSRRSAHLARADPWPVG
jgi:hypothetical protein